MVFKRTAIFVILFHFLVFMVFPFPVSRLSEQKKMVGKAGQSFAKNSYPIAMEYRFSNLSGNRVV